jgi:hypothetical protein
VALRHVERWRRREAGGAHDCTLDRVWAELEVQLPGPPPGSWTLLASIQVRDSYDGENRLVLDSGAISASALSALSLALGLELEGAQLLRLVAPFTPNPEGLEQLAERWSLNRVQAAMRSRDPRG